MAMKMKEGSAKDMREDKAMAKKRGMPMKMWEKSAADKKHDAPEKMAKGGAVKKMNYGGMMPPPGGGGAKQLGGGTTFKGSDPSGGRTIDSGMSGPGRNRGNMPPPMLRSPGGPGAPPPMLRTSGMMKKGGAVKKSMGGTVRGAGCATRGKTGAKEY